MARLQEGGQRQRRPVFTTSVMYVSDKEGRVMLGIVKEKKNFSEFCEKKINIQTHIWILEFGITANMRELNGDYISKVNLYWSAPSFP